MATFMAVTASNGPRLKDAQAARKIVERYLWDGDVQALIRRDVDDGADHLEVYGYDWPAAWKVPEGADAETFEPDYDADTGAVFEEFLRDIAPFLAEPLTIQATGAEKCRFPIAACEWHVSPGSPEIEISGFKHGLPASAT
jgi:hypothetical protein